MTLLTPSLISPTTSKLLSYLTFSTYGHDNTKSANTSASASASSSSTIKATVSDDPTLITIVMKKDGTATTKCLNPSLPKSATISSSLSSRYPTTSSSNNSYYTTSRRRRSSFSSYPYLSSPPKQRRLMISSFIPRFTASLSSSISSNNKTAPSSTTTARSNSKKKSRTASQKKLCSMTDWAEKGEMRAIGGMVSHPSEYLIVDTSTAEDQHPQDPPKRIQLLPSELMINIILSLDCCPSLLNLAQTCKQFYKLCHKNHHYLWQTLFYADYAIARRPLLATTATATAFNSALASEKSLSSITYFDLYKNHYELNKRWKYGRVQTKYLTGHEDSVYCLAWLGPDLIISGSRDRSIKVWDLSGNTTNTLYNTSSSTTSSESALIMTKTYHDGSVLCIRLSNDKTFLVSGSSDATCFIWSLPQFEPTQRLIGHTGGVLDVCIVDPFIISSSRDATIRVWDKEKGIEVRRLVGHAGPVNALGSHGHLVASASGDTTIKLWDIFTGNCLRTFTGHTRGLACIKFDGTFIYSGGQDNMFRVWDAHSGNCVATLPGHTDLIRTIDSFENLVVSGSYDRTLRVWDIQQNKCILSFQSGHSSWIFNCLVNRTKIISAGQDKRIMVLDFGYDLVTLD